MKMEQTECSEMSAYKVQTPGNYPEESIQHSEYSESLKSRKHVYVRHKLRNSVTSTSGHFVSQSSTVLIHNYTNTVLT